MDLKDKIVIVTGSSDGIGAKTALAFAKEGAHVVVTYCTQEKKGKKVFNECKKLTECMFLHLDVRDDSSIKNCVEETIDKFGAIDILVNNAGVIQWKDTMKQSLKEIDEQVDVNLTGLIHMTKAILPYFQGQDDGIVINVASEAGKTAYGELSVYSATKFGVRGFTQGMAEEYNKNKIRFYSVNPGLTKTKMTNYSGVEPEFVADIIVNTAKENLGKKSGDDVDF